MAEFEIREFYEPTKKATSLMILLDSAPADFAFKLLELGRLKTKKSVQVVFPSAGLGEEFHMLLQPSQLPPDLDFWWEDFLIGSRDRFRSLEFREYFMPTRCQVKIGGNIAKVANWDSSSAAWIEDTGANQADIAIGQTNVKSPAEQQAWLIESGAADVLGVRETLIKFGEDDE